MANVLELDDLDPGVIWISEVVECKVGSKFDANGMIIGAMDKIASLG